jgi:hypothetical protein
MNETQRLESRQARVLLSCVLGRGLVPLQDAPPLRFSWGGQVASSPAKPGRSQAKELSPAAGSCYGPPFAGSLKRPTINSSHRGRVIPIG